MLRVVALDNFGAFWHTDQPTFMRKTTTKLEVKGDVQRDLTTV
jgi:hypothetical protein